MIRFRTLAYLLALLMSVGSGFRALAAADAPAKKPNFLFILMDDLGWRDVGYEGSRYYLTPHIDQLATQGMVFTDAYAAAPNCAPSRACLMTGEYTPRHGIYTVGTSERGRAVDRKLIPTKNTTVLDPKHETIAEVLKPAGYTSALIGKWHIGADPDSGPIAQGFDLNFGGNHAGAPASYFSPYKNKDIPDGPTGEYLTDRLTDEAIKFITANKDKPFYLQLSHYAVHAPLQGKADVIAKYKARPPADGQDNPTYAAMVESMDDSVGRLMKTLDELKLADNTVVVFFSDNGGMGGATSNAPLRGAKGMLYEGGIREPMIVRWPGQVKAGSTCHAPVIGVDFLPTLAELGGAALPTDQPVDGVSLAPLLKGEPLPERAIYWHCPVYLEGHPDWKGSEGLWRNTPDGAIRVGDWKLIEFFETGKLELYNLATDLSEAHNVAADHPDKVKELHDRMIAWRESTHAPVPTEANPKYDPNAPPPKRKPGKEDND